MAPSAERSMVNVRFWTRARRALQIALVLSMGFAVWVIGMRGDGPAPVLPATDSQFSLDLKVMDTADHDIVYAVEQRARPSYRIFAFDPRTGEDETIFTVPEDAIIYGMALSPERTILAVAYSPDFELDGSGIWTLDLRSDAFTPIVDVEPHRYLTDPAWSLDGERILATSVDRSGSDDELTVTGIALIDGSETTLVVDAIDPLPLDDAVYVLNVDDDMARRSISRIGDDGSVSTIEVGDGNNDLDHLLIDPMSEDLLVAVLTDEDGGFTIGQPAAAHGSHDVPSSWWTIDTANEPRRADLEPTIVYDAASSTDGVIYATREGLSIGTLGVSTTVKTDIIASRSLRFVTG